LLPITIVGACSDIQSTSIPAIEPHWTILVDQDSAVASFTGVALEGAALPEGGVEGDPPQDPTLLDSVPQDPLALDQEGLRVRLTGGDAFRVVYNEQTAQLYRRGAPLQYQVAFPISLENRQFELRLDRSNANFANLNAVVQAPTIQTFAVAQDGMLLPAGNRVNVSWSYDETAISNQDIMIEALSCINSSGGEVAYNGSNQIAVAVESRVFSVMPDQFPQPPADVVQCDMAIELYIAKPLTGDFNGSIGAISRAAVVTMTSM